MDIKIKATTRAAILIYDLEEANTRAEMSKAQRVNSISVALIDYFDNLRAMRKYDTIVEIDNQAPLNAVDKKHIIAAREYYHQLLIQHLTECGVLDFLD